MSPQTGIQTQSFGPFDKGIIDAANPSLDLSGAFRTARNFYFSGVGRMALRPGVTSLTGFPAGLFDDESPPQFCTSVIWVGPYVSGSAAITYSSITQKCYLYTAGVGEALSLIGQIWHGMTSVPDVSVCEGLGYLYIANTIAQDPNLGVLWPTKFFDGQTIPPANTDLPTLMVNAVYSGSPPVLGSGVDAAYFNGVIAFQQALWGWGFGAGTLTSTAYRPEMARFSTPSFGTMAAEDSITLGDEVRSQRQQVIGAGVAGESLFLAGTEFVSRITGTGRDSWYRQPISDSYGMVGPKCGCTAGTHFYYWSPRGPMRINGLSYYQGQPVIPEPLFDQVAATVATVVNEQTIVAVFDNDRDRVCWFYDQGEGVTRCCAYDHRRSIFVTTDEDMGIPIRSANTVRPVYQSAGNLPTAPQGPPTNLSTSNVNAVGAQANWVSESPLYQTAIEVANTAGDPNAGTTATTATYTLVGVAAAGVQQMTVFGQAQNQRQWRARHVLNGQYSAYAGPSAATIFTPAELSLFPAPLDFQATVIAGVQTSPNVYATWTNTAPFASTAILQGPSATGPWSVLLTVGPTVASVSVTVPTQVPTYLVAQHFTNVFSTVIDPVSNAVLIILPAGP